MPSAHFEVVARGFEHFAATGDFLDELFHPDFVWDMSTFRGWPEQAEYAGIAGARQFMADWSAAFDDLDIQVVELLDADESVVAVIDQTGRSRTTGLKVDMHLAQVWTVMDGLEHRMRMYADVGEAKSAAGLAVRRSALIALAAALAAPAAAAAAPPDGIRAGGPSLPSDPKVALVGSAADLGGTAFQVKDSGATVRLSGTLGSAAGSPAPWAHVSTADLSSLGAGTYTVCVPSCAAPTLTSTPWIVRASTSRDAITKILEYFDVNHDGSVPSAAHGASHLNDAKLQNGKRIDITGGWMDAGDMLHFTQTTGYSAAVLQAAARLDPADAAALDVEADVGIDWLLKAHPLGSGRFVAQVGDERDHERPTLEADPADDDTQGGHGIRVRVAYKAIGGDLAGKAAAALAMAADRTTGQARSTRLQAAREWYAAGRVAHAAAPALRGDFYTSTTWKDDMAAGAAALYRTTGEAAYLADARRYLAASDVYDMSWDDFAAFAAADLCGALGAAAAPGSAGEEGCARLDEAADVSRDRVAALAFGIPAEFAWGTTAGSSAAGALTAMAAAQGIDATANRLTAAGARDWLLGRNPWGRSFVVGYGPSPPQHVHHWLPPGEPPPGAVVGGPAPVSVITGQGFAAPSGPFDTTDAAYVDDRDVYVTSEPAIDYSASAILLLAALAS